MNTLHQCYWQVDSQNTEYWQRHFSLMDDHDSLVIYGPISVDDQHYLHKTIIHKRDRLYWLNTSSESSQLLTEINHDQWLRLLIQHNNSYTWK